jgi:hypothetical protein
MDAELLLKIFILAFTFLLGKKSSLKGTARWYGNFVDFTIAMRRHTARMFARLEEPAVDKPRATT